MELKGFKGIGPKTLEKLHNNSIYTTEDVVLRFPKAYHFFEVDNSKLFSGDVASVFATVSSRPYFIKYRRNVNAIIFYAYIDSSRIKCVIFSNDYLRFKLFEGTKVILTGKYRNNEFFVKNIFFDIFQIKIDTTYGLKDISDSIYKKYVLNVLNLGLNFEDYLPKELIKKYRLIDYNNYVYKSHFLQTKNDYIDILRRGKYEEFFWYALSLEILRIKRINVDKLKRNVDYGLIERFLNNLDFKITDDQKMAIDDCYKDIISTKPMNRLIQGDVGCGKSIVGYAAMLMEVSAAFQVAVMLPTELLATEQFSAIKKALNNYNLQIELLTSSTKDKEREDILYRLAHGRVNILVGTHALIEDRVIFRKLGLVIIDEQHKFGVNQRKKLISKFSNVDAIYLTATPIPRTLGLTAFGDLDISSIHTLPKNKKPIKTLIYDFKGLTEISKIINNHLLLNEQVYIVCSLVNENENIDAYDIDMAYNYFNSKLKNAKIGKVHGKMSPLEKDSIMNEFHRGALNVLISTTVIEVGINVPKATIIVILNAERFGLAQLHQLRGRVGRSDLKSCCILVSDDIYNERLDALKNTNDGFEIANSDFKLRGPGDYLGDEQSGFNAFEYASFTEDFNIWECAKEDAKYYAKEFYETNSSNKKYLEILDSIKEQKSKIN